MSLDNSELYNTTKLASKKENIAKDIFYNNIVPLAQESFEHDGKVMPMVFVFLDDGTEDKVAITPMPAAMFMESDDTKQVLSDILKEFTNVIEIVAIGMFAEAWATRVDAETGEQSEKNEIVYYSFESENMVCMQRDEVVREEGKPVQLKHGKVDQNGEYSGKFVGFLKDMRKIKEN